MVYSNLPQLSSSAHARLAESTAKNPLLTPRNCRRMEINLGKRMLPAGMLPFRHLLNLDQSSSCHFSRIAAMSFPKKSSDMSIGQRRYLVVRKTEESPPFTHRHDESLLFSALKASLSLNANFSNTKDSVLCIKWKAVVLAAHPAESINQPINQSIDI
jgi:hypothetical protein